MRTKLAFAPIFQAIAVTLAIAVAPAACSATTASITSVTSTISFSKVGFSPSAAFFKKSTPGPFPTTSTAVPLGSYIISGSTYAAKVSVGNTFGTQQASFQVLTAVRGTVTGGTPNGTAHVHLHIDFGYLLEAEAYGNTSNWTGQVNATGDGFNDTQNVNGPLGYLKKSDGSPWMFDHIVTYFTVDVGLDSSGAGTLIWDDGSVTGISNVFGNSGSGMLMSASTIWLNGITIDYAE